jgi:hypothetical protein
MREAVADLWSFLGKAEHVCITTNPIVNAQGHAVMGRGCALEAAQRWPESRKVLAAQVQAWGNKPHALGVVGGHQPLWNYPETPIRLSNLIDNRCFDGGSVLWSFPVKHHWRDAADPDLIADSARRLKAAIDIYEPEAKLVVLPRPGCGNGRLEWPQVAEVLAGILDDRFLVVTK